MIPESHQELAAARKRICPECGADMEPVPGAPGAWRCPNGHGEWLPAEQPRPAQQARCPYDTRPNWLGLPYSDADLRPPEYVALSGPLAPGGGSSRSRQKTPQAQKMDAWRRRPRVPLADWVPSAAQRRQASTG